MLLQHKFVLLILFTFCCTLGFSINEQDSLFSILTNEKASNERRFEAINEYYRTHTFAEPDSVLELTEYHLNLAKEKESTLEMSKAFNEKSFAYYVKGNLKNARLNLENAISLLEKTDKKSDLATFYVNLGNISLEENNYQEAVKQFNNGLAIFKDNGQKLREATVLSNLGLIFIDLESYELALDYLLKAEQVYSVNGYEKEMGNTLLLIGTAQFKLGNISAASNYCNRSLDLLKQANNKVAIAECYSLFANINERVGDKEKALEYLNKSLETDQSIGNKAKNLSRLIYKLSLTSQIESKYPINEAEYLLKEVIKTDDPELKANIYKLLHEWYKQNGNYNLALTMYEKHVSYSDTIQLLKSKTTLVRNAIKNDFEEKLYQTKLANEQQKSEIELKNLKRTFLIILLCILLVLGVFLYYQYVLKKNKKKREELLNELERLKNLDSTLAAGPVSFNLDRDKIEKHIDRKLNETDWKVLSILLEDPVISNKELAEKAYLSVDGIGSSLRRMYEYFNIKQSKYKKISLLLDAIKISNE